jgi:hypothetical protein
MNKTWKNIRPEDDPVLLRVEVRIISETDRLSRDTLEICQHVIVTSVEDYLRETSKKRPETRMISELILYEPRYKYESRHFTEVRLHTPPFVPDELSEEYQE